jgi:hypothetical protein
LFLRHSVWQGREGERGRGRGYTVAGINRQLFDTGNGSIEMKLNGIIEPAFKEWLIEFLKVTEIIRKHDAEVAGADIVGCSQKTTKRYLEKMLNPITGVIDETVDAFGVRILKLRPDFMSTGKPPKPLQQAPQSKKKPLTPSKRPKTQGKAQETAQGAA